MNPTTKFGKKEKGNTFPRNAPSKAGKVFTTAIMDKPTNEPPVSIICLGFIFWSLFYSLNNCLLSFTFYLTLMDFLPSLKHRSSLIFPQQNQKRRFLVQQWRRNTCYGEESRVLLILSMSKMNYNVRGSCWLHKIILSWPIFTLS